MAFVIRKLQPDDLPRIAATSGHAWRSDPQLWTSRLQQQDAGERMVLLALNGAQVVGYGSVVWRSQNPSFADAGIPEIQDVVVAESYRRQGAAKHLIAAFERLAVAAGHKQIGIGVGVYADYGSAQRLYVRLGYLPDGRGVTYRNQPVPGGSHVRLDDHLLLWLTKPLL